MLTEADREALTLELGDVLWYLSEPCTQLGVDLNTVAQRNLEKLYGCLERGTMSGDGDDR